MLRLCVRVLTVLAGRSHRHRARSSYCLWIFRRRWDWRAFYTHTHRPSSAVASPLIILSLLELTSVLRPPLPTLVHHWNNNCVLFIIRWKIELLMSFNSLNVFWIGCFLFYELNFKQAFIYLFKVMSFF